MALTPLILLFLGGLLVLFLTGRLLGHIIGLDKYFRDDESKTKSHNSLLRKEERVKRTENKNL